MYNGCTMSVYGSVIPGAKCLAGIPVSLSRQARQRLKWFDYYNDRIGASFFFQLVSRRYERGSIIITSNKSYGD